jgi:hypothetical protein
MHAAGVTPYPGQHWMTQVARNVTMADWGFLTPGQYRLTRTLKSQAHGQDRAMTAEDVAVFLEHWLREVPGQLVIIWEGAPLHRGRVIRDFPAKGAAQRIHVERLPAYAPALKPGEGLGGHLKGVELCHVCCFTIRYVRRALHDAAKRVRRKPRMIRGCFDGATL